MTNYTIAQDVVDYMYTYDLATLTADEPNKARAVMTAYDTTAAQLNGSWAHVAWYLITQIAEDVESDPAREAYDILEELFNFHGIG